MVSWASEVQFISRLKGYAYLQKQAQQSYIYVIDGGLDPSAGKVRNKTLHKLPHISDLWLRIFSGHIVA